MSENTVEKPKGGFRGGDAAINRAGRRPKDGTEDKKTNRILRSEQMLLLVRKFRPHLSKAVAAAVSILDNKDASESGKLKASALIISTYKDLIKDLYDYRYDEEEGEEIQDVKKESGVVFSLRMIDGNDSTKE